MVIQNDSNFRDMIMGESQHKFIYGYNGAAREQLLRALVKDFPVTLDSSEPIGIYLDSIGLPKFDVTNEGLRKDTLRTLCREYRNFSIVTSLLDATINQVETKALNERSIEFVDWINLAYGSDIAKRIRSIKELRDIISEGRNTYRLEYENYIKSGEISGLVSAMPIMFISLEMFISTYKKMINAESYIALVVDHQTPIAIKSQQAINDLVASRITAHLSMKVACDPEGWETYYDLSGNTIDDSHDCGIVEIDDSNFAYTKKLMDKYQQ